MRNQRLSAATLAIALQSSAAFANDCDTVLAAFRLLTTVPAYEQTITMDKDARMRARIIGDVMYIQQGDAWQKMPLQQDMRQKMLDSMVPDAQSLQDCKQVATEPYNGTPSTAFDYVVPEVEKMQAGAGHQRLGVGGADGLPYGVVSGKTSVTFTYADVTAP